MSTPPVTPRTKTSFDVTTPTARRTSNANIVQSSPHYTTTRRHSLYGVEDRVIIDAGTRIWKVGFSGEGHPRDVFLADTISGASLWDLRRATTLAERTEEEKLLEVKLQRCIRSVFHDSLLTDPKARKVILVENPLMPVHIKDIFARILFENHVPSISFASSHLLSLIAVGRITGLVLDCGNLESVALPIFAARPLYSQLRTTPLAGCRLSSHLRALLLLFGTYVPPPASLSTAISIPSTNRSSRIPQEVLTDTVVEEIKTRCCFVGESLRTVDATEFSPIEPDIGFEFSVPPSESGQSGSGSSFIGREGSVPSEFSVVSSFTGTAAEVIPTKENHLQALANLYMRHSTATDLRVPVAPPVSQQTSTGQGTLIIPGWIRERAAEVLFEGGDIDESSIAEVILDALLKVPMDLRKTLASSILISGGTTMLPGFIPRLHDELLHLLYPVPPVHDPPPPPGRLRRLSRLRPRYDRFACLRPLLQYIAVLNNPTPPPPLSDRAKANAGRSPAFTPATLAWVGGSLAGALRTSGIEVAREKWDEVNTQTTQDQDDGAETSPNSDDELYEASRNYVLPDWTRAPLPFGAPPANPTVMVLAPVQAEVQA